MFNTGPGGDDDAESFSAFLSQIANQSDELFDHDHSDDLEMELEMSGMNFFLSKSHLRELL